MSILYIVIPCYNEEEMLPITTEELEKKMNNLINKKLISDKSMILYVNDGSRDQPVDEVLKLRVEDKSVTLIDFSSVI